jgi:hypothetical protein
MLVDVVNEYTQNLQAPNLALAAMEKMGRTTQPKRGDRFEYVRGDLENASPLRGRPGKTSDYTPVQYNRGGNPVVVASQETDNIMKALRDLRSDRSPVTQLRSEMSPTRLALRQKIGAKGILCEIRKREEIMTPTTQGNREPERSDRASDRAVWSEKESVYVETIANLEREAREKDRAYAELSAKYNILKEEFYTQRFQFINSSIMLGVEVERLHALKDDLVNRILTSPATSVTNAGSKSNSIDGEDIKKEESMKELKNQVQSITAELEHQMKKNEQISNLAKFFELSNTKKDDENYALKQTLLCNEKEMSRLRNEVEKLQICANVFK